MKRMMTFLLAFGMLLTLFGCGPRTAPGQQEASQSSSVVQEQSSDSQSALDESSSPESTSSVSGNAGVDSILKTLTELEELMNSMDTISDSELILP